MPFITYTVILPFPVEEQRRSVLPKIQRILPDGRTNESDYNQLEILLYAGLVNMYAGASPRGLFISPGPFTICRTVPVGTIYANQRVMSMYSTFCCSDLTGRRRVSVKCWCFGSRGLEEGVWMAKHRMKTAIKMTKAMPMRSTAYQNSVTHWAMVSNVSWLNSIFFSRTRGPSASTLRHLRKTSQ